MLSEIMLDALNDLRHTLATACWGGITAAGDPHPASPISTGQCAPTALLVQDLFGGELLRTEVAGVSHYFNRIDGEEVDLTRDQFPVWTLTAPVIVRDRDYLLGHPDTATRYNVLAGRYRSVTVTVDNARL